MDSTAAPVPPPPPLAVEAATKRFGDVAVLEDVSLAFLPGEVHAVIGENGAGKSTLMRILAGLHAPSSGTVRVNGQATTFRGVEDAERAGIVLIHQELNLAESLSIEANLFLGREPARHGFIDRRSLRSAATAALARVGASFLDPATPVHRLSIAHRQLVEIAKALAKDARVLLLDEPTAVLDDDETATLFGQLRALRFSGTALVYISHRLEEVRQLADRVSVLRDGRLVTSRPAAGLTTGEMAALMVGRELGDLFPPRVPPPPGAPVVLSARGASVPGWAHDVSFDIRAGEILGFAGLVGAGRTELWEGLLGLRPGRTGSVVTATTPLPPGRYRSAVEDARCVYLSEDRKGRGLHLHRPLRENVVLMSLHRLGRIFTDRTAEQAVYDRWARDLSLRAPGAAALPRQLSGGNQQKVALAKILETGPRLVVLDEPTRGVDVGTKAQIYRLVADLAARGVACAVVSSELPELRGLCHRLLVLREGRLVAELPGDAPEVDILRAAAGVTAHAA